MSYQLPTPDGPGHARLGERHPIHETGVIWRVVKRARFRPSKVVEAEIVIDNLSVTGAGVLSAADVFVKLGQVVDIRLGAHWGQVRVLHCRATDDPAVRYWGVEFLDNDNAFNGELSRRLDVFSAVHGESMRDWDGD